MDNFREECVFELVSTIEFYKSRRLDKSNSLSPLAPFWLAVLLAL
ncbi:MAG: hypothetical protein PHS44_01060 [Candidatus Dojkabacteria bacterium]|nr:hypothetical protein [Candidatus Dojkabacteria bacterium]